MFQRCGLEYRAVQAESGMMGGKESVDFLAPSGSGENTLVTCENGDFAADLEIARGVPRAPRFPRARDAPEKVETPGVTTIEALAEMLGIDAAATSKAMPVTRSDGTLVLGLVRGDDRLPSRRCSPRSRATSARRPTRRSARRSARAAARSARSASTSRSSPTRRCARASSSRARTATAGISRGRGGSRLRAALRRHPRGARGRHLPRVRRCAPLPDGDRGRPHLQVRRPLLGAARCDVPRRGRHGEAVIGGSYGIGPGRIMAAAVEQSHDENGIVWPRRSRRTTSTCSRSTAARRRSRGGREDRRRAGRGRLRRASRRPRRAAGEKFADADLIGVPLRVIVGKKTLEDGAVDVRRRDGWRKTACLSSDVLKWVGQSLMARRRRYSDDPFGPTIERLMAETGTTYRGLAAKADLSAGYLNHIVHGNRPVPFERRHRADRRVPRRRARALPRIPDPCHHRQARAMPELIDRLYKRLA